MVMKRDSTAAALTVVVLAAAFTSGRSGTLGQVLHPLRAGIARLQSGR
jgi:hypothetical protein